MVKTSLDERWTQSCATAGEKLDIYSLSKKAVLGKQRRIQYNLVILTVGTEWNIADKRKSTSEQCGQYWDNMGKDREGG